MRYRESGENKKYMRYRESGATDPEMEKFDILYRQSEEAGCEKMAVTIFKKDDLGVFLKRIKSERVYSNKSREIQLEFEGRVLTPRTFVEKIRNPIFEEKLETVPLITASEMPRNEKRMEPSGSNSGKSDEPQQQEEDEQRRAPVSTLRH